MEFSFATRISFRSITNGVKKSAVRTQWRNRMISIGGKVSAMAMRVSVALRRRLAVKGEGPICQRNED
jgi:hypothetical protein